MGVIGRIVKLLGLAVLLGVFGTALGAEQRATLIYSANLDGELEPCGCSAEGDFGGIRRRATLLQRLRADQPDLFLVSGGGLITSLTPRDRLKSEYIFKGMTGLGYDAFGVQWSDLSYGPEFMTAPALPWVASNWRHGDAVAKQRLIERGGVKLAFFAWLDPKRSPFRKMEGDHDVVLGDIAPTKQALQQARQAGALTVLSTALPLEEAQRELPLEHVSILIIRSAYEVFEQPKAVDGTLVLQPGSRGMRLGRLNLVLDGQGGIASWTHEVIPMGVDIPDAPELQAWYDEYNAKVKEAYLAKVALTEQQAATESPYLGAEECQYCHAQAFNVWDRSLHRRAFELLEEVGKSFDPDCIVCHVVDFERPGGYIDNALTPHLRSVQCESCHGPSREHAETEGTVTTAHAGWPKEKMCAQCHTQPHSPGFNLGDYWPGIAH